MYINRVIICLQHLHEVYMCNPSTAFSDWPFFSLHTIIVWPIVNMFVLCEECVVNILNIVYLLASLRCVLYIGF
jgi:hypothetical protein